MKSLGAEDLVAGGFSLVLSNERYVGTYASRLLQFLRLKNLELNGKGETTYLYAHELRPTYVQQTLAGNSDQSFILGIEEKIPLRNDETSEPTKSSRMETHDRDRKSPKWDLRTLQTR